MKQLTTGVSVVGLVVGSVLCTPMARSATSSSIVAGSLNLSEGAVTNKLELGVSPSLWLDASCASSVSNLWLDTDVVGVDTPYSPTITCDGVSYQLVERWSDRRQSPSDVYGYNDRHRSTDKQFYPNVYPCVVKRGLNGLDYISMSPSAGDAGSSRRLQFQYNKVKPKFVVMVFGSQQGGGNAILANAGLGRGAASRSQWSDMSSFAPIMTNTAYKTGRVWVDGQAVDPTTTGFDGGWQVISIKFSSATRLGGIGYWNEAIYDAGGQNYAEILFFDDALTDSQREKVENYLIRKWGLVGKYKGNVSELISLNAYGTGEIVLNGVFAQLRGNCAGFVKMSNWAGLKIPYLQTLPSENDVVAIDGRIAWFDPDCDESISYFANTNLVNVLADKRLGQATGAFALAGPQSRAPSAESRKVGFAPERTWLQYANISGVVAQDNGRTLRMNRQPNAYKSAVAPATNRTVFLVQDSSQGGGVPFLDEVLAGSKVRRFSNAKDDMFCKDWTRPIWNADAIEEYFGLSVGGRTYLNGESVDGEKDGFTGEAEILTAVAGKDWALSAVAGYMYKDYKFATKDTDPHTDVGELQGEMLVFDRVLSDFDRQKVEAYLAYKWIGVLPNSSPFGSVSDMILSGEGKVQIENVASMPGFTDDFYGIFELEQNAFDFDISSKGEIKSLIILPTVRLQDSVTLNVSFPEGRPERGKYVVMKAKEGLDAAKWTFNLPEGVKAKVTSTEVIISVSGGFVLFVQ